MLLPARRTPHAAFQYCLFLLLILVTCAQEVAPPGGPPDTFAPYVVNIMPPDGTIRVATDTSPVITFNERIDLRSLDDAVFIVPLIPFKFKSNWDGNEITIEFEESLQQDKTYVITIGTTVRDLRNNRLTSAVVYAFSTGALIDQGEINGMVVMNQRPAVGAFMWAYNIRMKPSPDPAEIPPDYIVQTGEDGFFRFTNLSLETYRVFAFRDQGRDRRYDISRDPLGVPTRDVILSEEEISSSPLWFQLAVRDTVAMYVSTTRAVHNRQVSIRLSKAADAETAADTDNYGIVDTESGDTLEVLTAYRDMPDSTSTTVLTAPQTSGRSYSLTLLNLRDYEGGLIDTTGNMTSFIGSSREDTAPPELKTIWPANRARDVPLRPDIRFTFTEPVTMEDNAVTLVDTSDQIVAGTLQWTSPTIAVLRPDRILVSNMQYTIHILINRIHDLADQQLQNSNSESDSISYLFSTVDPNEYGMIFGLIADEDSTATGSINISISNISNRNNTYQTRIPSPGSYRFDELLPGRYTVYAYRDANQNGRFDFGAVVPFTPAERAIVYPDTIPVRSGWESEGIDLRIRP